MVQWLMSNPWLALQMLLAMLFVGFLTYGIVYMFFIPMDRIRTVEELKPGDLKYVTALGLQLAVFRGKDSKEAYVTHAYCPHLGANVAVGGKVVGNCVECPFHKWSFSGETGQCTCIPYIKNEKVNGLINIWYHADGEEPSWEPEVVPEILDGAKDKWVYQGRNEYEVGGEPSSWMEYLSYIFNWHEWGASWKAGDKAEGRGHMANIKLQQSFKINLLGMEFKPMDFSVSGAQIGPGMVHLYFSEGFGRGIMLQYSTPLEPCLQKLVHVFYTERSFPAPIAKMFFTGESVMIERDIRVWNSKTYEDRPMLVKEDQAIRKHRIWYSQFYSNNSNKVKQQDEDREW